MIKLNKLGRRETTATYKKLYMKKPTVNIIFID